MHDVNFFFEYRMIEMRKRSERLVRSIAVCLAAGLALGTYLGNEIRIGRLSRVETDLSRSLNDPLPVAQYRTAKENEIELLLLLAYESWLVRLDEQIGNHYLNTSKWAGQTFGRAPAFVTIERISRDEGTFSITGTSPDEDSIASYKSSIDDIPDVTGTSIQRVEFVENRYRFSISGKTNAKKGG